MDETRFNNDETKPLLTVQKVNVQNNSIEELPTQVYRRRWWILTVYSSVCFLQAFCWGCWGPVAQSAKAVFNWTDGDIGMLANWGNIAYIITVFPACYLMDTIGMKKSMLGCVVLVLIATGIRCITSQAGPAYWLMNAAAIINGVAGTVPFAGPPQIASLWFPPEQRATATAIASMFNYAGIAATFAIGPQLVTSPNETSVMQNTSSQGHTDYSTVNETLFVNKSQVTNDIMKLMYAQAIAAMVCFLAVVIYFPDKPPLPPSTTASIKRIQYKKALKNILGHKNVWLIVQSYAIAAGVYGVYGSVFDIILNPIGVSQTEAGWIGFYSTIAGSLAGLGVARFSDMFMRHMKLFLITMYLISLGSFVWLTLLCSKIIVFSNVQLYISSIVGGMFLNGSIPLFYELACEASYPVSEGVTGGFMTCLNNIYGILFLLMLQIPNIGTSWMNWCLVGSVGLSFLFLFVFPERYTRTDIDIVVPEPTSTEAKIKSEN